MASILNKTQKIVGILFGIVLFYFWLIFIYNIKALLFSETFVINNNEVVKLQFWDQIDQWLDAGLIVFFLIFGHYLLYRKNMSQVERKHDIIGMKSILIGFFLWLLITIITFLFRFTIPYSFNIAGGYLTIIITYFIMKRLYMQHGI